MPNQDITPSTFPQNLEKGFFISDISTIQIYESKFLNEMEKYVTKFWPLLLNLNFNMGNKYVCKVNICETHASFILLRT